MVNGAKLVVLFICLISLVLEFGFANDTFDSFNTFNHIQMHCNTCFSGIDHSCLCLRPRTCCYVVKMRGRSQAFFTYSQWTSFLNTHTNTLGIATANLYLLRPRKSVFVAPNKANKIRLAANFSLIGKVKKISLHFLESMGTRSDTNDREIRRLLTPLMHKVRPRCELVRGQDRKRKKRVFKKKTENSASGQPHHIAAQVARLSRLSKYCNWNELCFRPKHRSAPHQRS